MTTTDLSSIDTMLQLYSEAARASDRLLESARESDWDSAMLLGNEYQALVNEIRRLGDMESLDELQRARKYELLLHLIDNDAAIRDLALPSLQRLGALINTMRRQRVLGKAYGQGGALLR